MKIAEKRRVFNRILFCWHKNHYRDMPWRPPKSRRRDRASLDPYHVLVSEIMLQQTQVDRVRAKYVEFLKKFPHIRALAKAPLGEVLRVWSGLGYNRRAHYLHDCVKTIVHEYGGKFPNELEQLRELPGIGLSTAGALLAFAHNRDEPMIDTNIRRILARTFFSGGLKKIQGRTLGINSSRFDLVSGHRVPSDQELYSFAKSLIPKGRGREWNYAMLDLGATLCTACNHSCECPLAALHGDVGDFRYKKPQKKFAGSDRFYRGRILAVLTQGGATTTLKLSRQIGRTKKAVRVLVQGLRREGLVIVRGEKVTLP